MKTFTHEIISSTVVTIFITIGNIKDAVLLSTDFYDSAN
jgi:hypothetical protein